MKLELFGVTVYISFTFFALLIFVTATADNSELLLSLLFSFVHELGHFSALFLSGEKDAVFKIGFFGGEILRKKSIKTNYTKEMIIHLSGPALNILLGALFAVNGKIREFVVNYCIGIFNLLPIFSLDGGKALLSLLLKNFNEELSFKIITVISYCVCVPLIVISFLLLFENKGTIQLTFISVYILILLIVKK